MEEVMVQKKRRRRRSYPVKLTVDGKRFSGYDTAMDGGWLLLDQGTKKTWWRLDSVRTFTIEEKQRQAKPEEPPVDRRRPMRLENLEPHLNVDPNQTASDFRKRANQELESLMGPEMQ